ncbi:TNFAIP3-interacting protein 3 [Nematostella vectensis]|uniref:TNFAIP3-interacting protein 3 n=1 Tax=Nematostella vectensis TaxID=45351 RepID=UPI00207767EA|nr:TNFAIP3-interacting protein 3 [Nematostella vectensis]
MANAGAGSTNTKSAQPSEERELVLKLLNEKRTLLGKLHEERKETLRWRSECLQLREEIQGLKTVKLRTGLEDLSVESENVPNESEDNASVARALHKKISILQSKIQELRKQNETLASQKKVLENEVFRLANSLSRIDPTLETELLKEQLLVYEEDFKKEKTDKVNAEQKISSLQEEIRESQELISSLTTEVDMYKRAYEREKEEKEILLVSNSADRNSCLELPLCTGPRSQPHRTRTLPKPTLQVVYPVSDIQEQRDDLRRRQQRAGVYSRNAPNSPTNLSSFYKDALESDCFWSS